MLNLKPEKKKLLGTRNGLKIFTKLRQKTPLKFATESQKERNKIWSEVTNKKIVELGNRCQWCGKLGQRTGTENFLSGHHIIKRRFHNDDISNCYIAHWITCHQFIENHAIDVSKYPTKLAWEHRKIGGG